MSERRLILVADIQDGIELAGKALSDEYDLVSASSLKEAEKFLIESETGRKFSLILAGLHFDDSQMIALLEYIRSVDHLDSLVFLPIQAKESAKNVANVSLNKMLELLGSRPVVQLNRNSAGESCAILKKAVSNSFLHSVNRGRIDEPPRNEIGSEIEQNLRA